MLLCNRDDYVVPWVQERMPYGPEFEFGPCSSIGILKNNQLIAGVVYSLYNGFNISMSIASTDPRWASRTRLYYLFAYPFEQLKCNRVSAWTLKKHKRTREFLTRLGFKFEGNMREGVNGKDLFMYGMLRDECKWLEIGNGKRL